ncbi:MAG: T9SS type A sorting domain-containing protein [Tannerella sp.]|jgi:poly(3-hydroxybutyrate) depolymerase|nr:T9SS type A sorting domain-containing protein [Tannerella sp.]
MQKKIFILTALWLIATATGLTAANPEKKTVRSGDFEREYLVYTPQNTRVKPDGLIVGLHGFNGSNEDFFGAYPIFRVADSLNYLFLAPQALPEQSQRVKDKAELIRLFFGNTIPLDAVWACGLKVKAFSQLFGVTLLEEELNKSVDDVEFIRRIIDQTRDEYALTSENIFLVGTSMGGYMAYQFALKQPVKPAGIVSIVGSMGLSVQGMDDRLKTPLCDFHSLTDEVVPYAGSYENAGLVISLAQAKTDVLRYWAETNGCGEPVSEAVNNYPSTNGITVEKITYPHPVYEVVHYRMNGSSHSYFFRKEAGDCMDYPEEITKFISSHASPHPGGMVMPEIRTLQVYPNPAAEVVYLGITDGHVSVCDFAGQEVLSTPFRSGQLDISSLKPGIYILRVRSNGILHTAKLIIQK